MKKAVLLCILLALGNAGFSQIKKFNYEFGLSSSLVGIAKSGRKISGNIGEYFEFRYNMKTTPVDIALLLDISSFDRRFAFDVLVDSSIPDLKYVTFSADMEYIAFNVIVVGDYVFRRGKSFEPFVGLGTGISFGNVETGIFNEGTKTSPCLMPRAGVRIIRHFSLSADYLITHKDYSQVNFRLGFYF